MTRNNSELLRGVEAASGSTVGTHHFQITFDDGPCYDVFAGGFGVRQQGEAAPRAAGL